MKLAAATRLLQGPLRGWVVPRAHISAKPAKTPTSPSVSTPGSTVAGLMCSWGFQGSTLKARLAKG